MLGKMAGIFSLLWLFALILSFAFSEWVHTLLVIASMLFLATAAILVQITKTPAPKFKRKKFINKHFWRERQRNETGF